MRMELISSLLSRFFSSNLEDKAIGCLAGGAIGDALGLPVEGWSCNDRQRKFGNVDTFLEMEDLPSGTYSDDTQLTLLIADSLSASDGVSMKDIDSRLVKWLDNLISAGGSCLAAARALEAGKFWAETGSYSAGCGAAMRAAPLGIFFRHSTDDLRKYTIEVSRITHRGREAVAGALAVAYAVAYLLNGRFSTPRRFVSDVAGFVGGLSDEIRKSLLRPDAKNSQGVGSVVSAAFHYCARSPDDFRRSVIGAVNSGGDVDSVAAITGNLSGAYNGFHRIPRRYVNGVENGRGGNREKGMDYIILTAKRLLDFSHG